MQSTGNADRGAELIAAEGCGSCHVIPGIPSATGRTGPPLEGFARQIYIAGTLPNTPENVVRWLRDPPSIAHGTAMPATGLSEREAKDVAAYLYALSQ